VEYCHTQPVRCIAPRQTRRLAPRLIASGRGDFFNRATPVCFAQACRGRPFKGRQAAAEQRSPRSPRELRSVAAKAAEAIADAMGAKGHRISHEGVEGTLRASQFTLERRINKGSAGVYRVCGKRTHEKLP
jgi:hypothetical protein